VHGRLVWQACNRRLCLRALAHSLRRAVHARQPLLVRCLLEHPRAAQVAASDRWQRLVPKPYQAAPLVVDAVAAGDVAIAAALADVARDAMLVLADADGNTCFHAAAAAADGRLLTVLLARIPRNAALQMLNARLETPLHAALAARREDNVARLAEFDAGSVLYAADLFSGNALQRCAWIGNAPCMRRLLERVPPSALFARCPSGYTTLMVACLRGDLELAELLLEATAGCPGRPYFLAVQSTFGQTCLHVAAMSGNEALVRRLAAAVPKGVVALRNIAGQTAAGMCGEMRMERAQLALESAVTG
jgi:ankyrin repeat protein